MIVSRLQGVEELRKIANVDVGASTQLLDPRIKRRRITHLGRRVGTKRWKHARRKSRGLNPLVMFERIGGIVGGAERRHAELLQDSVGRQIPALELFIGAIPYLARALVVQQ